MPVKFRSVLYFYSASCLICAAKWFLRFNFICLSTTVGGWIKSINKRLSKSMKYAFALTTFCPVCYVFGVPIRFQLQRCRIMVPFCIRSRPCLSCPKGDWLQSNYAVVRPGKRGFIKVFGGPMGIDAIMGPNPTFSMAPIVLYLHSLRVRGSGKNFEFANVRRWVLGYIWLN